MRDPFKIHRDGRVTDRETGDTLGKVWRSAWVRGWRCSEVDPLYAQPGCYVRAAPTRRDAARLLWERAQRQKEGG